MLVNPMIVSAIDGRIRVIDPSLKNKRNADAVKENLQTMVQIRSVRVNRITGSLLVLHEPSAEINRTIRKTIKHQLKTLKTGSIDKRFTGKRARKNVKMVMLASIIGSMALLTAGSEKWHFRIGTVFLSFLLLHLYQNKKRIFK